MAEDTKESVERSLARLVGVTEKSGNLRNDLRKDNLEAVSSLINNFVQVQTELEAKTTAHKELEREARESSEEMQRLRGAESNKMGQVCMCVCVYVCVYVYVCGYVWCVCVCV